MRWSAIGVLALAMTQLSCDGDAQQDPSQMIAHRGVELWVKVAGPKTGRPAFYLHGGPGDNSYIFERAVGTRLEKSLQMVYFDQRGSGRSSLVDEDLLGLEALVGDIEQIRKTLGFEQIDLIGHSFGGALALEYLERFPNRVGRILFVDVSADLNALVKQQVDYVEKSAKQLFPEHSAAILATAQTSQSSVAKLGTYYSTIGMKRLQRQIQFPSDESFQRFEQWTLESGLRGRSRGRVAARLFADGYFASSHSELMKRLPIPSQVLAGRHSHITGETLLTEAADVWGSSMVWLEDSGHFPFFDQPDAFAEATIRFFKQP